MADRDKKPEPKRADETTSAAPDDRVREPSPEEGINSSLHDVLDLLAAQVEKLKASLEFHRLSNPDKTDVIRWHVEQIDQRQDRMEEVKQMILVGRDDTLH